MPYPADSPVERLFEREKPRQGNRQGMGALGFEMEFMSLIAAPTLIEPELFGHGDRRRQMGRRQCFEKRADRRAG